MAPVEEDSDEYDYIDDPIKLIHCDLKTLDDCNNNSEEFLATLRESALKSRPVVRIIDYKKFPWYFKRCMSQHTDSNSEIINLDDDYDDDDLIIVDDDYCNIQVSEPATLVIAESNSTIVEKIENIAPEMSSNATKPKIRPVNVADYNLGSGKSLINRNKNLIPKTIGNKDAEKNTVKPAPIAAEAPPIIDFKKNLVVGLKIVKKVTTVVSKSRSKIKDLFGDDDDVDIPVNVEKNKVRQENIANNKNETKNFMNSYLNGMKILPYRGETSKLETLKTATKSDSVTSKHVISVRSPDRFCNKFVVGSKPSPHSNSINDISNMTQKIDSQSKPEKTFDDGAIEIKNASLKFTITRKNIDEYCLSINDSKENKKSEKKEKIHKKRGRKPKSKTCTSSKGDDVSSRDKIKFKRDKKHNKECAKSKKNKTHKKDKNKLIEKEFIDIMKEVENITLKENILTKNNQSNAVKYIVHTSKLDKDAVNLEKNKLIDTLQEPTYLNEKVVNDVLRLQCYVDNYGDHDIAVSNPTEITGETVIATSNNGTPVQTSISISYTETPNQLTIPEQSKHPSLGFLASQQKHQETTSSVEKNVFITDPEITSQVSSKSNDQRSKQTSKLFKERPLQAKHKSICQTHQTKSPNNNKTPPPLCNVEPLRNSNDGSSKPFSAQNCKDLSMPSLSPDPENEPSILKNQNNKNIHNKSCKDAKRHESTIQKKKEKPKQIPNATIIISSDTSSAKNVKKENKHNNNKSFTSSTTTVSGKQQNQIDNIKELEKIHNSIEANIQELEKMKNLTQVSIQEHGNGPMINDSVSKNTPNNLPHTGPLLQDPSSQNVQLKENLNPTPSLNVSNGQNQNRFHAQYPYNNYFHHGFRPRGPMYPHMFHGPRIHRPPPPWLYQSMEPRQRYPARMPRQMFHMPPNTPPPYRPYNSRMPADMMPRMRNNRPTMPPRPISRTCNTPIPAQIQMMSPTPTDMIPHVSTCQSSNTPTPEPDYQPCYTSMPTEMTLSMQTSQPCTTTSVLPVPASTSQSCDIPIPTIPISGSYNNQHPSGMMSTNSESLPYTTQIETMPLNSQPYNNPMVKDFMPPAYLNTSLPTMQNSHQYNTQMTTQMIQHMPTPTDVPSRVSELPLMPQPHTSNIQSPSNIPRPQPPCTPMPRNMPHPQPSTTPSATQSTIQAKTWSIPPASKYVRCSPLYENPPLNLYYPSFCEQNSLTDQSQTYQMQIPLQQGPGSSHLSSTPSCASNLTQISNNQIPLTESSTDNSIIGRNPDDGNFIRKIALSKPNSSSVTDFSNNISISPTYPVRMPKFNVSFINESGQSVSPKLNESSVGAVIASPKITDSDAPITDKSQMLVELCKAVGIEEDPINTTPTKGTLKRPAAVDSMYPILTHMLIPKKRKYIETESQNKSNVKVSQSGYSPPILPIPTHEKTIELMSQTRLFSENKAMNDSSVAAPNISDEPLRSNEMLGPEKVSNDQTDDRNNIISVAGIETVAVERNEEKEGKDKSVRKISLDEYKKRVTKMDDTLMTIKTEIKSECLSPNSNQDGGLDAIRQSTESDHGYDSDSTVRL